MFLPSPLTGKGWGLLPVALVGVSGKGLFSCADGEAAAGNGFRVRLVNVWHDFLKGGGIEPSREI